MGEGLHHVPGLVEAQVSNMGEVWEVLKTGSNARAVGSTNSNEHSSRSHWLVLFTVSSFSSNVEFVYKMNFYLQIASLECFCICAVYIV